MKKNASLLLLSWMLAPGLALAQDPAVKTPPASSDVKTDHKDMQALDAKHAADVKDLNAKETAAMQAVKDDKTLTSAQRKEKLAAIRGDFKTQRKALNATFRDDKKKIQGDMKKDRADSRKEARDSRVERQERHEGVRHEGGKNK